MVVGYVKNSFWISEFLQNLKPLVWNLNGPILLLLFWVQS